MHVAAHFASNCATQPKAAEWLPEVWVRISPISHAEQSRTGPEGG